MLELLQEVKYILEYETKSDESEKVYDKVCQAIEDLKSISEPIGAKIENVEVME